MLYNINTELGQKLEIAIKDTNSVIEIKKKFHKYFEELDKYKLNENNDLKQVEIDKIKNIGFDNYCSKLVDKFCTYIEKFDTSSSYIVHELKIDIPPNELKEGIPIEKYINYSI